MKKIAICSSVSFYKDVSSYKKNLTELGFKVFVPDLVLEMEKENNFDYLSFAEKFDSTNPNRKKYLIDSHFEKIKKADAILIINNQKHNIDGYIGANVLMEITVAYFLNKEIYILHNISNKLSCFDEVMAMAPIFINNDLKKIKSF